MYFNEISGSEIEKNLDAYSIFDVRSREEYSLGHVNGAVNIPYDEVLDYLEEFKNTEKQIVLYCRTNNRSSYAGSLLVSAGISDFLIAPGVAYYNYKLTK